MEKTNQGKKRSVCSGMFLFLPGESERPTDKKHLRQVPNMSKVVSHKLRLIVSGERSARGKSYTETGGSSDKWVSDLMAS